MPRRGAVGRLAHYESDCFVSNNKVTGPLLIKDTSIIVRNCPVSTPIPCPATSATNNSYNCSASSGVAAATKLGRRPFRQSPKSVNWLTTSMDPPVSTSERFILSWLSSKIRNLTILSASCFTSCSVSPCATPNNTTKPWSIWPTMSPSTQGCLHIESGRDREGEAKVRTM